jgi:hypothetical protein
MIIPCRICGASYNNNGICYQVEIKPINEWNKRIKLGYRLRINPNYFQNQIIYAVIHNNNIINIIPMKYNVIEMINHRDFINKNIPEQGYTSIRSAI